MIVLGIILAVIGWLAGISLLLWIGVALLVVGAVVELAGAGGRPIGGRRHWY